VKIALKNSHFYSKFDYYSLQYDQDDQDLDTIRDTIDQAAWDRIRCLLLPSGMCSTTALQLQLQLQPRHQRHLGRLMRPQYNIYADCMPNSPEIEIWKKKNSGYCSLRFTTISFPTISVVENLCSYFTCAINSTTNFTKHSHFIKWWWTMLGNWASDQCTLKQAS